MYTADIQRCILHAEERAAAGGEGGLECAYKCRLYIYRAFTHVREERAARGREAGLERD